MHKIKVTYRLQKLYEKEVEVDDEDWENATFQEKQEMMNEVCQCVNEEMSAEIFTGEEFEQELWNCYAE